MTQISQNV